LEGSVATLIESTLTPLLIGVPQFDRKGGIGQYGPVFFDLWPKAQAARSAR